MAVKIITLALDNGVSSHTINAPHHTLINTSWFWLTHGLMGAILQGSLCLPHFRSLGKHSLNRIKDHLLVARGLYCPLTHLQLMQAMAEQLQHSCETCLEMAEGHYANVYDKALGHITNTLHTVLLNRALEAATSQDREQAREHALTSLQDKYNNKIHNYPEHYNIFTTRLINKILDTFQDESRDDIEEWWSTQLKDLQDSMEGWMVFIPTKGVEITRRFEDMKAKFFDNARQQLMDKKPGHLKNELKAQWDTHVNQQFENQKPATVVEVETCLWA